MIKTYEIAISTISKPPLASGHQRVQEGDIIEVREALGYIGKEEGKRFLWITIDLEEEIASQLKESMIETSISYRYDPQTFKNFIELMFDDSKHTNSLYNRKDLWSDNIELLKAGEIVKTTDLRELTGFESELKPIVDQRDTFVPTSIEFETKQAELDYKADAKQRLVDGDLTIDNLIERFNSDVPFDTINVKSQTNKRKYKIDFIDLKQVFPTLDIAKVKDPNIEYQPFLEVKVPLLASAITSK